MEILLILIFVLIVGDAIMAILTAKRKPKNKVEAVNACPPHKWEYKDVEGVQRLKCGLCNMLPGESTYSPRSTNVRQ